MVAAAWTDADTARACQIWTDYQRQHDVSNHIGRTAGIDPSSGDVWFGESAADIALALQAKGVSKLLYFVRVGSDYYIRKGVFLRTKS